MILLYGILYNINQRVNIKLNKTYKCISVFHLLKSIVYPLINEAAVEMKKRSLHVLCSNLGVW